MATLMCVPTWTTDFRKDLAAFDVPTLVVQGDQDRILPIDATGNQLERSHRPAQERWLSGARHGQPAARPARRCHTCAAPTTTHRARGLSSACC
ncbi:alpha/beta fold hydrolase [Nonomuraea sp. 3N208]|uniref:alpha/beta fold hydrolase n=1 Tax=Nonomuraea sp. 3N208 TaxID=3457421 RepID=UPI003FD2995E